jgi:putative endonuclease
MHFIYIIHSETCDVFYKGYTMDVHKRLVEHNTNKSRYTANKGPWRLLVVEEYPDKKSALIRERALKRCKRDYFHWLSRQSSNVASRFFPG